MFSQPYLSVVTASLALTNEILKLKVNTFSVTSITHIQAVDNNYVCDTMDMFAIFLPTSIMLTAVGSSLSRPTYRKQTFSPMKLSETSCEFSVDQLKRNNVGVSSFPQFCLQRTHYCCSSGANWESQSTNTMLANIPMAYDMFANECSEVP